MASKTEWEGHTRIPRTWLLDDGSTITEPFLERTTGGRRVRSAEDPKLAGSSHDASNVAFTAVMRKVKDRGRVIICEAHTLDHLKQVVRGVNFNAEPPMLHLTNDYYAEGGYQQTRLEQNSTRFWTTWEHPTLPIHFVSSNGLTTTPYSADLVHGFYHLPFFPGLGQTPGKDGLYSPPSNQEVASSLGNPTSSNPFLARTAAYWEGCEFFGHYPPGMATARIVEGRREALRQMLIAATAINRLETLEVPDVWSAVLHESTDMVTGKAEWQQPLFTELRKTGTNIDEDTVESFKAYVTGAESAQKAAKIYKELRAELIHAGIVLGEVSDDQFIHMLTNTTRPFTASITGARNVTEGKASGVHSRRGKQTLTEQHSVVVDLVTGFIVVGCPHGDEPGGIPALVREAWDEAHTIASLSGQHGEYIKFANEFLRVKAENKVLTEALARRK